MVGLLIPQHRQTWQRTCDESQSSAFSCASACFIVRDAEVDTSGPHKPVCFSEALNDFNVSVNGLATELRNLTCATQTGWHHISLPTWFQTAVGSAPDATAYLVQYLLRHGNLRGKDMGTFTKLTQQLMQEGVLGSMHGVVVDVAARLPQSERCNDGTAAVRLLQGMLDDMEASAEPGTQAGSVCPCNCAPQ